MEKVKSVFEKINLDKIKEYINNPYIVGIIALLVVVYGSFLAPSLPEPIAKWFGHPLFKMIFIFTILLVHKFNPLISIILTIAFIISIQILTRYKAFNTTTIITPHQKPSEPEMIQIKQEITDEIEQDPQEENNDLKTQEGLHPRNRPTKETLMTHEKIDNNDPKHPATEMMYNPELNTAIYELNPPFAIRNLPTTMTGDEKLNNIDLTPPIGGPTRYSAYHGYKKA